MTPKSLPHFKEGEAAVIGTCILNPQSISKVMDVLTPGDFHDGRARTVFDTMITLATANRPVDLVTLPDALQTAGKLSDAGGIDYLAGLIDASGPTANVMHYAQQVKAYSVRRDIIRACLSAMDAAYSPEPDVPAILGSLSQTCYDLASVDAHKKGIVQLGDINRRAYAAFCRRVETGTLPGIPTGFVKIDNTLGGLQRKELTILAARPSVGKSGWALDAALHAVAMGFKVVIFSLEMSADGDIWQRLIAKKTGIDLNRVRQAIHLKQSEIGLITTASGSLDKLDISIDDATGTKPIEMIARLRNWGATTASKPDLIIVDHLQLVHPDKGTKSRNDDLGQITSRLKGVAKDFDCAMLALCQLNREIDKRPVHDRIPQLIDLRESGNIEQDADVIMGLFRLGVYLKKPEHAEYRHHAELWVIKNRNGPTGHTELFWEPPTATFKEKSSRDDQPYGDDAKDRQNPPF